METVPDPLKVSKFRRYIGRPPTMPDGIGIKLIRSRSKVKSKVGARLSRHASSGKFSNASNAKEELIDLNAVTLDLNNVDAMQFDDVSEDELEALDYLIDRTVQSVGYSEEGVSAEEASSATLQQIVFLKLDTKSTGIVPLYSEPGVKSSNKTSGAEAPGGDLESPHVTFTNDMKEASVPDAEVSEEGVPEAIDSPVDSATGDSSTRISSFRSNHGESQTESRGIGEGPQSSTDSSALFDVSEVEEGARIQDDRDHTIRWSESVHGLMDSIGNDQPQPQENTWPITPRLLEKQLLANFVKMLFAVLSPFGVAGLGFLALPFRLYLRGIRNRAHGLDSEPQVTVEPATSCDSATEYERDDLRLDYGDENERDTMYRDRPYSEQPEDNHCDEEIAADLAAESYRGEQFGLHFSSQAREDAAERKSLSPTIDDISEKKTNWIAESAEDFQCSLSKAKSKLYMRQSSSNKRNSKGSSSEKSVLLTSQASTEDDFTSPAGDAEADQVDVVCSGSKHGRSVSSRVSSGGPGCYIPTVSTVETKERSDPRDKASGYKNENVLIDLLVDPITSLSICTNTVDQKPRALQFPSPAAPTQTVPQQPHANLSTSPSAPTRSVHQQPWLTSTPSTSISVWPQSVDQQPALNLEEMSAARDDYAESLTAEDDSGEQKEHMLNENYVVHQRSHAKIKHVKTSISPKPLTSVGHVSGKLRDVINAPMALLKSLGGRRRANEDTRFASARSGRKTMIVLTDILTTEMGAVCSVRRGRPFRLLATFDFNVTERLTAKINIEPLDEHSCNVVFSRGRGDKTASDVYISFVTDAHDRFIAHTTHGKPTF